MGIRGPGTWQNDEAVELPAKICRYLERRIGSYFSDDKAEISAGENEVIPAVELLYVIGTETQCPVPDPEVVQSWKDSYLARFDLQIEQMEPARGYTKERRLVVVKVFDKLIRLCRSFWRPKWS